MKNGKGFIAPLLVVGILVIGLFAALVVFGPQVKNLGLLSLKKDKQESQAAGNKKDFKIKNDQKAENSNKSKPETGASSSPTPSAEPSASPNILPPTTYRQPQGKYTLSLPSGWSANETSATGTYSTTRFSGNGGSVSVTFGSGKDPIGGCSETTSVSLFDRTISACFLLQKDGSQIMTRGYTKDKAGLDFTIEATFGSPISINRPLVLDILKTIDIE